MNRFVSSWLKLAANEFLPDGGQRGSRANAQLAVIPSERERAERELAH